mgnify:FL=1
MFTDQSEHPPDVVTLKSQCVQLVSDTGIETVPENFFITESSPAAKRTLLRAADSETQLDLPC